ncbi:DNA helicase [Tanacetum coccineum]
MVCGHEDLVSKEKEMTWKGCTTFADIRTVNKIVYSTFRGACEALGLLGDNKEWHTALEEASFSSTPTYYDRVELAQEVNVLKPKLNAGQRQIYERVIDADKEDQQALIFVYGHGGTGKTFLWKVLISSLRSKA